jgi:hypothetical protein
MRQAGWGIVGAWYDRVTDGPVFEKMASIEVWDSCSGIFPTSVFVMAFLQVMKFAMA